MRFELVWNMVGRVLYLGEPLSTQHLAAILFTFENIKCEVNLYMKFETPKAK